MRSPHSGKHTLTTQKNNSPGTTNSTRVRVEVVTSGGRGAALEFRIRADTDEVWHREHLAAVFDRLVLSNWLLSPGPPLVVDEVSLSVDWQLDRLGRVAVTLPDVNAWALSPTELDTLYRRVVIDLRENTGA